MGHHERTPSDTFFWIWGIQFKDIDPPLFLGPWLQKDSMKSGSQRWLKRCRRRRRRGCCCCCCCRRRRRRHRFFFFLKWPWVPIEAPWRKTLTIYLQILRPFFCFQKKWSKKKTHETKCSKKNVNMVKATQTFFSKENLQNKVQTISWHLHICISHGILVAFTIWPISAPPHHNGSSTSPSFSSSGPYTEDLGRILKRTNDCFGVGSLEQQGGFQATKPWVNLEG